MCWRRLQQIIHRLSFRQSNRPRFSLILSHSIQQTRQNFRYQMRKIPNFSPNRRLHLLFRPRHFRRFRSRRRHFRLTTTNNQSTFRQIHHKHSLWRRPLFSPYKIRRPLLLGPRLLRSIRNQNFNISLFNPKIRRFFLPKSNLANCLWSKTLFSSRLIVPFVFLGIRKMWTIRKR